MDEDCTTLSRVKSVINHDINKYSDIMHVKKHVLGDLYKLQKSHKVLTANVIKYIGKCFTYAVNQNKGNVEAVRKALLNIVPHLFDKHAGCGEWCKHKNKSDTFKYNYLPNGKAVSGCKLEKDLSTIFSKLGDNAVKIAPCASTRENESFNNIVASKAPKSKHYSGSGSLVTRVESAVCQKNMGHSYLSTVFETAGLSPGKFYSQSAEKIEKKRKRDLCNKNSLTSKRRRLNLTQNKSIHQLTNEMKEGKTYETSIGLQNSQEDDVRVIPDIVCEPLYQPVDCTHQTYIFVFFDLETSLSKDCEILQLSACYSTQMFNYYVMPQNNVCQTITELTGISISDGQMYQHGQKVDSVTISKCLSDFVSWLKSLNNPIILVGHNCKTFDAYRLLKQFQLHGTEQLAFFEGIVHGFADSLPLFRKMLEGVCPNFKQTTIVQHILGNDFHYVAHDAKEDAVALENALIVNLT